MLDQLEDDSLCAVFVIMLVIMVGALYLVPLVIG